MKKPLMFSIFLGLGLLGASVSQTSALTINPSQNVIVTFKQDVKSNIGASNVNSKEQNFIANNKSKIKRVESHLHSVIANLSASDITQLKQDPNVVVENNIKVKIAGTSAVNTIKDYSVTGENVDWGHAAVGIPADLSTDLTGKGVKIAVLDTGVLTNHPDLNVAGGVDCSHDSSNGTNVCSTTPSSYNDDNGHGTFVLGEINSQINGLGMVGVAPNAQIYAVKVLDSTGSGYLSDILDGLNWSIENHMDVVNMSFGSSTGSYAEQQAMDTAKADGIILVAAAGNEGNSSGTGTNTDYPANYSSVLSVAAVDQNDARAYFSSTGKVDVAAPGVNILSTTNDGQYGTMMGTSMAAPYVTGMVALYKEKYPTYTADQIISVLESNAKDLGPVGKDSLYGFGLIQYPSSIVTTPVAPAAPTTPIVSAPTGFQSGSVTSTHVGLVWTKASNTTYILKRNDTVIYTGTSGSFVDFKVTPNTNYQYTLTAKVGTSLSDPVSISVKTPVPSMKSVRITATYSTQNAILLKWDGAKNYRYELYRNGVLIYNGNNNAFLDSNLVPSTSYNYQLISYDQYGQSFTYNASIKTSVQKSAKQSKNDNALINVLYRLFNR